MTINMTTGLGGVTITNARIYFRPTAAFSAPANKTAYDALKSASGFEEIGAASKAKWTPGENKTYESSYYGRKVTQVKGTLEFTLDNVLAANIAALEALNHTAIDVLVEEVPVEASTALEEGTLYLVLLGQIFNFTGENMSEDELIGVPIKFEARAKTMAALRHIDAVPAEA